MAKIIGRTEEIVSMNRLYDSGMAGHTSSGFLTAFEGFWNTWGCWADALHPHGFDASLKRTAEPPLSFYSETGRTDRP